jgi:hypothetical protein
MKHTPESIKALLSRNNKAVMRGLETVKRTCGFSLGGFKFGTSLCDQLAEGRTLSPAQINKAREMLIKSYLPVLARVANDNEKQREEQARVHQEETEAERGLEEHYERQNELAFIQNGYANLEW